MANHREHITNNTDITVDQMYIHFDKKIKDINVFNQRMQFIDQMYYLNQIIQVVNDPLRSIRY